METMDLDINHYDMKELLHLFHLDPDFGEKELKQAKQIVLKTHPDKSGLDSKYFLFFSRAYKMVHSLHVFKNKTEKSKDGMDTTYTNDHDEDNQEQQKHQLNQFFEKKPELQKSREFNAWFNEQFEKNKIQTEQEQTGYGDWLRSDEDVEPEKNVSLSQMGTEFEKKKQQIRALIVKQDLRESYVGNFQGISTLDDGVPQEYSSDLFSQLPYQDLKKAHAESVIPVTQEDYRDHPKFKNVNDYVTFRNKQDTRPISELDAEKFFREKQREDDIASSHRAFALAKQVEESQEKSKQFWKSVLKLENL